MIRRFWFIFGAWGTLCTLAFVLHEVGSRHGLPSALQRNAFPAVQRIHTIFSDLKFRLRGQRKPASRVVIVEIDSPAIEELGRWPWRRDYVAYLIDRVFSAGARAIGLDLVFSEPQNPVPDELADTLAKHKLSDWLSPFQYDSQLEKVFRARRDRLVLAWMSESACRPGFSAPHECPVADPQALATFPEEFPKFSVQSARLPSGFSLTKTPLFSVATLIPNLARFNQAVRYSGFVNDFRDGDGLVRRTSLLFLAGGKVYPSLPLELARLALGEEIEVEFGAGDRLEALRWRGSKRVIPTNSLGLTEINFRGGERRFSYVSARDLFRDDEAIRDDVNRRLAGSTKSEVFQDAVVLIGVSALALSDVAATPYDAAMPGVEVHATVLDNLLAEANRNGPLTSGPQPYTVILLFLLLTVGMTGLAMAGRKWEARHTLAVFAGVIVSIVVIDGILFERFAINASTGFLYMHWGGTFLVSLAGRYFVEERNRKFLRSAFSKYVAPAVVDVILKDPKQLSIGGRKENLTILFSDIRSFTTFSEKMDAPQVGEFLNDYLGILTEIVFSWGGTLDKYIGDAIMAFWGAPLKDEKHAYRACQAAIAMARAVDENRARFERKYGILVHCGIGLNSGDVNVGNMGSSRNFSYTVIGDGVNLASRIESATKYFGVTRLITKNTLDSIIQSGAELPAHRLLGSARLKGKKNAVEVAELRETPLPAEAKINFDMGRELFLQHRFEDAAAKFRLAALIIGADDGPCKLYLEACERFRREVPGPYWDGVWNLEH